MVDFCHPEYEKYLTASKYNIFRGQAQDALEECDSIRDIHCLFESLKKRNAINTSNIDSFRNDLDKITIETYSADGSFLTPKTRAIKHVHCELNDNEGNTYFYIDGDWYRIQADFLQDLNNECQRITADTYDDKRLDVIWDESIENEDRYNQKYLNKKGFYVLHKITPENLEPCDIIDYNNKDILYLIYVKQGFNASMRDLTSQISIASRRILEDTKSNKYEFIGKVYNEVKSRCTSSDEYFRCLGEQFNNVTKRSFINLFKNKKLIFCLAFVDTGKGKRNIKDNIKTFDSNIAKFSIIELYRKLGIHDLKIAQVGRRYTNV